MKKPIAPLFLFGIFALSVLAFDLAYAQDPEVSEARDELREFYRLYPQFEPGNYQPRFPENLRDLENDGVRRELDQAKSRLSKELIAYESLSGIAEDQILSEELKFLIKSLSYSQSAEITSWQYAKWLDFDGNSRVDLKDWIHFELARTAQVFLENADKIGMRIEIEPKQESGEFQVPLNQFKEQVTALGVNYRMLRDMNQRRPEKEKEFSQIKALRAAWEEHQFVLRQWDKLLALNALMSALEDGEPSGIPFSRSLLLPLPGANGPVSLKEAVEFWQKTWGWKEFLEGVRSKIQENRGVVRREVIEAATEKVARFLNRAHYLAQEISKKEEEKKAHTTDDFTEMKTGALRIPSRLFRYPLQPKHAYFLSLFEAGIRFPAGNLFVVRHGVLRDEFSNFKNSEITWRSTNLQMILSSNRELLDSFLKVISNLAPQTPQLNAWQGNALVGLATMQKQNIRVPLSVLKLVQSEIPNSVYRLGIAAMSVGDHHEVYSYVHDYEEALRLLRVEALNFLIARLAKEEGYLDIQNHEDLTNRIRQISNEISAIEGEKENQELEGQALENEGASGRLAALRAEENALVELKQRVKDELNRLGRQTELASKDYIRVRGWTSSASPERLQKIESYLGVSPQVSLLAEQLLEFQDLSKVVKFDVNGDQFINKADLKLLELLRSSGAIEQKAQNH